MGKALPRSLSRCLHRASQLKLPVEPLPETVHTCPICEQRPRDPQSLSCMEKQLGLVTLRLVINIAVGCRPVRHRGSLFQGSRAAMHACLLSGLLEPLAGAKALLPLVQGKQAAGTAPLESAPLISHDLLTDTIHAAILGMLQWQFGQVQMPVSCSCCFGRGCASLSC